MKLRITILIVFINLFLIACRMQKTAYQLPEEMKEPVKVEYAKLCDKGKILYDLNCAGCHNTRKRGKELIPDFTADQLETYKIRNSEVMGITEEKVSAEELGYILLFLTYKKKNPS